MLQLTAKQISDLASGAELLVLRQHKRDELGIAHLPMSVGRGVAVHRKPDPGRKVGPARHRATVTRVREVRLGELADQDARRLGHADLDELMAWWVRTNGLWNEQSPVWVVHIRHDPDELPRWPHRLSERGYTHNRRDALADESVSVDDETLEVFALDAIRRHDPHVRERRSLEKARTLGRRTRELSLAALRSGVVIDRELRAIELELDSIERRMRKAA